MVEANNICICDREYIAPELHQANRLSAKADVYSFGVLVLETTIGCRMYNCLKRNVSIIIDDQIL